VETDMEKVFETLGCSMHRFIDDTPVSAVVILSVTGALQMFISWATPALQFLILLGSAILVVWKCCLAFEQMYKKFKKRRPNKKRQAGENQG